jgi:hypothetical protein
MLLLPTWISPVEKMNDGDEKLVDIIEPLVRRIVNKKELRATAENRIEFENSAFFRLVSPRAHFNAYSADKRGDAGQFAEYVTHLINAFIKIDRLRSAGIMALCLSADDGPGRTMDLALKTFSAPVFDHGVRLEIGVGQNRRQPDPGAEIGIHD